LASRTWRPPCFRSAPPCGLRRALTDRLVTVSSLKAGTICMFLHWIGRAKLGGGMKVDYDARLHAVYAAGRQMSPDALQTWMEAFARHLPETRPLVWLDLGSGTGRMTPSL